MNKLTALLAFGLAASVHATAALSLEPCPEGSARTCPDGSLFFTDAHPAHCGGVQATCVPITKHQLLDAAAPAHVPEFDQASVVFPDQEYGSEESGSEVGDEDKYENDEDADGLDDEEEDALDEDDDLDKNDLDGDQDDLDKAREDDDKTADEDDLLDDDQGNANGDQDHDGNDDNEDVDSLGEEEEDALDLGDDDLDDDNGITDDAADDLDNKNVYDAYDNEKDTLNDDNTTPRN